jgi:hypothetical protein
VFALNVHRPFWQWSSVQPLPSSHSRSCAQLAVHVPPWHMPMIIVPILQRLPSVVEVWTHPAAASQASIVQPFPSLQSRIVPGMQIPPEQVSPKVQASPSSQAEVLFVCTHPSAGSQVSSVHGL